MTALTGALQWYAAQVATCRKIGPNGDVARAALAKETNNAR